MRPSATCLRRPSANPPRTLRDRAAARRSAPSRFEPRDGASRVLPHAFPSASHGRSPPSAKRRHRAPVVRCRRARARTHRQPPLLSPSMCRQLSHSLASSATHSGRARRATRTHAFRLVGSRGAAAAKPPSRRFSAAETETDVSAPPPIEIVHHCVRTDKGRSLAPFLD